MAEAKAEKGKEKSQSPDKEKQQREKASAVTRFSDGVRRYFRETRGELRRVTWPTREESQRLTLVVIGVTIAFAIFLGALDFVFSTVVGEIIRLLSTI